MVEEIEKTKTKVEETIKGVVDETKKRLEDTAKEAEEAATKAKEAAEKALEGIDDKYEELKKEVGDFAEQLAKGVVDTAKDVQKTIGEKITEVTNKAKEVPTVVDGLLEEGKKAVEKIIDTIEDGAAKAYEEAIKALKTAAEEKAKEADAQKDLIEKGFEAARKAADEWSTKIKAEATTILDSIKGISTKAEGGIPSFTDNMMTDIGKFIADLTKKKEEPTKVSGKIGEITLLDLDKMLKEAEERKKTTEEAIAKGQQLMQAEIKAFNAAMSKGGKAWEDLKVTIEADDKKVTDIKTEAEAKYGMIGTTHVQPGFDKVAAAKAARETGKDNVNKALADGKQMVEDVGRIIDDKNLAGKLADSKDKMAASIVMIEDLDKSVPKIKADAEAGAKEAQAGLVKAKAEFEKMKADLTKSAASQLQTLTAQLAAAKMARKTD